MIIKLFILTAVLLLAYGFAVILLRRLTHCSEQIAALHHKMALNDEKLQMQLTRLRELQEEEAKAVASSPSETTSLNGDHPRRTQ